MWLKACNVAWSMLGRLQTVVQCHPSDERRGLEECYLFQKWGEEHRTDTLPRPLLSSSRNASRQT